MKQYVCRVNSTSGLIGQIINREETDEATRSLLERGIIAEVKIDAPAEVKEAKVAKVKK